MVAVAITVAIAVLSLGPEVTAGPATLSDKALHAAAYLALTLACLAAIPERRLAVAAGVIAYGLALEFTQLVALPERTAEAADLLANLAGVVSGVAAYWAVRGSRGRPISLGEV